MLTLRAAITGVGAYLPEYVLTNQILETMVDTTDEWITTRTGVKERRLLKTPGWAASDMGAEAVKSMLEKTNTAPEDIDLLICATVTGDMKFPDTANLICYKSGLTNAYGFDVGAACSGFLFALNTGAQFIKSGTHRRVIVVGVDVMSSIVDYTDRTTCVIFGDGCGCVLLEADESGNGIEDAILRGDGSGKQYLHMKGGGSLNPPTHETVDAKMHYIFQDGQPVFRAAVKGMTGTLTEILERNHYSKADLKWIVPHQANKRIINTVADMLDFPHERVMSNIHKYGNTTAATLPLCLWDYESQLKKGDLIALTAFGGGFTWGSLLLRWAY